MAQLEKSLPHKQEDQVRVPKLMGKAKHGSMHFSSGPRVLSARPDVRHHLGLQTVTMAMAMMFEQMTANVDTLLKGIGRYNPENLATLERYVEAQAKDNAYDLEANLGHPETVPVQPSLLPDCSHCPDQPAPYRLYSVQMYD